MEYYDESETVANENDTSRQDARKLAARLAIASLDENMKTVVCIEYNSLIYFIGTSSS